MAQPVDILPGTRGYKTHMRKQSKRSIAGKKDGLHYQQNRNKLY